MRVDLFDFDLPPHLIAQQPMSPRDEARLLFIGNGGLRDNRVCDLPHLLQRGDLLIFNDTEVIPAALRGTIGDKSVSLNLHKQESTGLWWVFAKPARHFKIGGEVIFGDNFTAQVEQIGDYGVRLLRFFYDGDFFEALDSYGEMPLPPYIKRECGRASDMSDYQTIFARMKGAVAAPTAGLHFTERLLTQLEEAGIGTAFVTLHVGGGTFLPVRSADTEQHEMHSEYGEISQDTCDKIIAVQKGGGRIISVGTTSLRILESSVMGGEVRAYAGSTDIFITPGFRFRVVDMLLTNFHLPRSSLFMLVCAFSGLEPMHLAYRRAIDFDYRFFSYGDACLLERL